MGKPLGQFDSQFAFSRPIYEWINRVNRRKEEAAASLVSPELKQKATLWNETEFVCSMLHLEGFSFDRADVEHLVAAPALTADPSSTLPAGAGILGGLRTVEELVEKEPASLTPRLLIELNSRCLAAPARFRSGPSDPDRTPKVNAPQNVVLAVESACQWFEADSFRELHAIEQAGIVLLRLLEIRPFEKANERTAFLAASLYMLRAGLPPLIIPAQHLRAYRASLEEGLSISTRPLVELLATVTEATLIQLSGLAGNA